MKCEQCQYFRKRERQSRGTGFSALDALSFCFVLPEKVKRCADDIVCRFFENKSEGMIKKCKNCYFYTAYPNNLKGYGPCKRNAPSIGKDGYPVKGVEYPMTHDDEECGEFKEKIQTCQE